jgi:hypothetical protein
MKPKFPRFQFWPLAALSSAIVLALVTASVGVARDEPVANPQVQPPDQKPLVFSVSIDEEHDLQISYEVRFIETQLNLWREGLEGKLTPAPGSSGSDRWIVDEQSLKAVIKTITEDPATKLASAPKATMFAGQHLVIRAKKGGGQSPPETTIRLCGKPKGSVIQLSVELSEAARVPSRLEPGAPAERSRPLVNDSFDLAAGASLLFSQDRQSTSRKGNDIKSERLILITPRKILLESEEVRIDRDHAASPAKP